MPSHVFLSYKREDKDKVKLIHDRLTHAGYKVWWDQDILPGQDWETERRRAMKKANAAIFCLSRNSEGRYECGIYPELRDAIQKYRNLGPSEIFIIPVKLSPCTLPDIIIDSIRDFSDLQSVDLFPGMKNFDVLLEALAKTNGSISDFSRSSSDFLGKIEELILDEKWKLAQNMIEKYDYQMSCRLRFLLALAKMKNQSFLSLSYQKRLSVKKHLETAGEIDPEFAPVQFLLALYEVDYRNAVGQLGDTTLLKKIKSKIHNGEYASSMALVSKVKTSRAFQEIMSAEGFDDL